MDYNPYLLASLVKETFIIHADSLVLSKENTSATFPTTVSVDQPQPTHERAHLAVFAKEVTIAEEIDLEGKNIFIYCGTLICKEGAAIKSTGKNGLDSTIEANVDQHGSFDKRQNGKDGGAIILRVNEIKGDLKLSARGGNGGRGQNGGTGSPGAKGATGSVSRTVGNCGAGGKGGTGAQGNTGGIGAVGGSAGQSGAIYVYNSGSGEVSNKIQVDTTIPKGGDGGRGGKGGNGGPGGDGGQNYFTDFVGGRGEDRRVCRPAPGTGPHGVPGTAGFDGKPGDPGADGSASKFEIIKEDVNSRNNFFSYLLADLLLRKAELQYINKQFKPCQENLVWLGNCLQSNPGAHHETSQNDFFYPYSMFANFTRGDWNNIRIKVANFLYQLSLGLDYFGNAVNYVTLLKLDALRKRFAEFYAIAKQIQEIHDEFRQDEQNLGRNIGMINNSINLQASIIEYNRSILPEIEKDINKIPAEIIELDKAISRQFERLVAAETDFKKAIQRKYGECSLQNLLKAANTLISIGRAIHGDVSAIINSVGNIESLYATRLSNGKQGLEAAIFRIETTVKLGGDIKDNLQNIYQQLSAKREETKSLIAMKREELDAFIEEHKALPEAQSFKAEIDTYFNLIETMNQKRLRYTQQVLEYSNLLCKIDNEEAKKVAFAGKLTELVAAKADAEIKNFIETAYSSVMYSLIRFIYLENKALEFLMLKSRDIVFPADISMLQTVHSKIVNDDFVNWMNQRRTVSTYISLPKEREIELTKNDLPFQFENFIAGDGQKHILDFTIDPFHESFRANWFEIFINTVKLRVFGCETNNGQLSFKLTQLGNSSFVNSEGDLVNYVHTARTLTMTYDYKNDAFIGKVEKNILGETADEREFFYCISPFASWRLEIFKAHNGGLNMSGANALKIGFGFYTKSTD